MGQGMGRHSISNNENVKIKNYRVNADIRADVINFDVRIDIRMVRGVREMRDVANLLLVGKDYETGMEEDDGPIIVFVAVDLKDGIGIITYKRILERKREHFY